MYNFATAVSFAGKIFAESWKTANNKKKVAPGKILSQRDTLLIGANR